MTSLELASLILAGEAALVAWGLLFVMLRRQRRNAAAAAPPTAGDGAEQLAALERRNTELTEELASAQRIIAKLLTEDHEPVASPAPPVPVVAAAPPEDSWPLADTQAAAMPPAEPEPPASEELPFDVDEILEREAAAKAWDLPTVFADDTPEEQLDAAFEPRDAEAPAAPEPARPAAPDDWPAATDAEDPLAAAFARAASIMETPDMPPIAEATGATEASGATKEIGETKETEEQALSQATGTDSTDAPLGDTISEDELEQLFDLFETPPRPGSESAAKPDR